MTGEGAVPDLRGSSLAVRTRSGDPTPRSRPATLVFVRCLPRAAASTSRILPAPAVSHPAEFSRPLCIPMRPLRCHSLTYYRLALPGSLAIPSGCRDDLLQSVPDFEVLL